MDNYTELKKAGMAQVVKINDSYAIVRRKFDSSTGVEIASEVSALDKLQLQEKRDALLKSIAEIDAILEDIEKQI